MKVFYPVVSETVRYSMPLPELHALKCVALSLESTESSNTEHVISSGLCRGALQNLGLLCARIMNCGIGRDTEAYSIWSSYMTALICRIGITIAGQHFLLSFGCEKIHTISELSAFVFVSTQPESSPGDVSLV